MTAIVCPSHTSPGWLRNRNFDTTFVRGVALVALLSGVGVIKRPDLFPAILIADLFLLGNHHVISTFTRLAFDRQSLREYRFYVFCAAVYRIRGDLFAGLVGGHLGYRIGIPVLAMVSLHAPELGNQSGLPGKIRRAGDGKSPVLQARLLSAADMGNFASLVAGPE